MNTHNKLTRPQSEEIFRQYFLTECYQGPQKMWRHKCGTPIRMRPASISIHQCPPDKCPGPDIVAADGTMEVQQIPYCDRCEEVPQNIGCLHETPDATLTVEIDLSKAPPILVWRFQEAPEEYRKLSPHGGDEDWLALIPPSVREHKDGFPDWLETPAFGVHSTSVHEVPGGFWIVIGAHS